MPTAYDQIGSRLKAIRIAQGQGVRVWGSRIGYPPSSIVRWESGEYPPPIAYVQALTALGVNGHWLLTGEGQPWGSGEDDPTVGWLRRVGLATTAATADPQCAEVLTRAVAGGVTVTDVVKLLGVSRQRADEILAQIGPFLRRARGGRYVPRSAIGESDGSLVLQLLDHFRQVLQQSERGSALGTRMGRVRVPSATGFWRKLTETIDVTETTADEGDSVVFVLALTKERGSND